MGGVNIIDEQVEALLRWARQQGFGAWHLTDRHEPTVIVLARHRRGVIDVIHLRGADRVEAARLEPTEHANIWRPHQVLWHYYGDVVHAITALRDLTDDYPALPYPPDRTGHPTPLYVTDDELHATKHHFPPATYDLAMT